MARVISVAACEPELPPVEMHSGTNRLSTTTSAIASSKYARAVNVNSSATNRHASQKARLRQTVTKLRLQVVLRHRADAAHAMDVLGRLLHHHVDHVVVR